MDILEQNKGRGNITIKLLNVNEKYMNYVRPLLQFYILGLCAGISVPVFLSL
jgi:hypothetical protein